MRKIAFILMMGVLFGQSSQEWRKIIQSAGDGETYAQRIESGEVDGVKLSDSQIQQLSLKRDAVKLRIVSLLSEEPVVEDEIPVVYELIDYLIGDADRRFYSRVRSNYIGRLQVARDASSVEEIDYLLSHSSNFYLTPKGDLANPREDTVQRLREIKAQL